MGTQFTNDRLRVKESPASPRGKELGTGPLPERRGNRTWSQGIVAPIKPTVTEFERVVARLQLEPDQYIGSQQLREWAEKNKDIRYIPERLLKAWRIPLRGSIEDIG
jgi:hypothetical protein